MLPSEVVANYFLEKSFDEGVAITQMKLLKLVYIAHGWHRGYFETNLINEAVKAWRYGPVIPDLYRKIKHYGRKDIDAPIDGYGSIRDMHLPNEQTLDLLDHVWDSYKDKDGIELSALTHEPNTPWDITWKASGGDTFAGATIANELIEDHYKDKIRQFDQ